jgi:hypothetical protein
MVRHLNSHPVHVAPRDQTRQPETGKTSVTSLGQSGEQVHTSGEYNGCDGLVSR